MQNSGAAAGDGKAFKNGERVCQNSVSGRRSFKSRKAVREVFIDSSSVFSFASSIFGAVVVPVSVPYLLLLVPVAALRLWIGNSVDAVFRFLRFLSVSQLFLFRLMKRLTLCVWRAEVMRMICL